MDYINSFILNNEKTDEKEEIHMNSNRFDSNQNSSSYFIQKQFNQKEVICNTQPLISKYQPFVDFFSQFKSKSNSISKTDQKWRNIMIQMFDIQEDNFLANSQNDLNKIFFIKLNNKEKLIIEKKMKSQDKNNISLFDVLKIKNPKLNKSFKKNILEGIPDSLRCIIWKAIIDPLDINFDMLQQEIIDKINIENELDEDNFNSDYSQSFLSFSSNTSSFDNINNLNILRYLSNNAKKNIVDDIKKDINRTLIQFEQFQNESFQKSLLNVLSAYSVIDNEVGYVQGMAFLAGILLLYMDEYSAFSSFSLLMLSENYKIRDLFKKDFPKIHLLNKIWSIALKKYFPVIYKKFKLLNIDPILYTVGWRMTAFTCFSFNKDISLLIFDRYLLYGYSSLISFGLIIIDTSYNILIKSSIDEVISLLQNPCSISKLNELSCVQNKWNKKFLISQNKFNKLMKEAKIDCLY